MVDDLVKVSWKSDAGKCQNQPTPPYFHQLSERHQPLYQNKVTQNKKNKLLSFFSPRKVLIQCETKDACQYDAYIRSKSMKTLNSTLSCKSLQISRDVSNSGYFPRALRYFKKCLKQLESRDILSKNIIVRALATFKL